MLKVSEIVAKLETLDAGNVYRYKPKMAAHCTVWQENEITPMCPMDNSNTLLVCSMWIVRFAPPSQTRDSVALAILGYLRDAGADVVDRVSYYDDLQMVVHEMSVSGVIYDA